MIPTVPLHMPCLIRELLRNMTRAPSCNLMEVERLVLVLNMGSEEDGSHRVEFIESMDCKIKNFPSEMGSILQTILLIC